MFSKLPSSLYVKEVPNQGNGIFTKKFVPKGKEVLSSMPYSFGVSGATVEDVGGSCHHCLKMVLQKKRSVICSTCKVISYCSKACLNSDARLHSMECKGVLQLEKYRGKMTVMPSDIDGKEYWPPLQVLMTARAINRKILQGRNNYTDEWLAYLSNHTLSPKADRFSLIKPLIRHLVPSHVNDDDIYSMYVAVCINSGDVMCPAGTSAAALYFEYSLLNHMCRPNCATENNNTAVSIYAIEDIQPGSQICISYLNARDRINVREIRRNPLKESFGFDCGCLVCAEELVVGSRFWTLDQQKRSLIAPWSREYADTIMHLGWKAVCVHESMDRPSGIKLLENTLALERKVLDNRNVVIILTIWRLLRCYSLLPDYKKGICHLRSLGLFGLTAFFEYGTIEEISEVKNILVRCSRALGLAKRANKLDDLFNSFFPKLPSSDMLLRAVGKEIPPSLVKLVKEKHLAETKAHVEMDDIVSCILNICDHV